MTLAVADRPLSETIAEPVLVQAIATAVGNALTMCDLSARLVGVAAVPSMERGTVTGLVGVHGRVSGFITVNFAERLAIKAVEGLAQDKFTKLCSQVVDGVGEVTNIVAGGIKGGLSTTPWAFTNITVPSVIVGNGYHLAFAKGLAYLTATFEHQDAEALLLEDRLLHVSMSLLRL